MNTYRQKTITFFSLLAFIALLAGGTASCDAPPVALEMPTPAIVTAGEVDPDPANAVGATPHRFQFDVALVDQGALELRSRILAQADRWARIVDGSDLEDIEWGPGTIGCGGLQYDHQYDVLDDVFVMVSVHDFNEGPGTGVRTSVCGYRESSKLPLVGAIILDVEGVPQGQVDDLILHAFGHMLGFGRSWRRLGLLHDSSRDTPGADTHFEGERAIAAFVAAGGANYLGARVPVENDPNGGTMDDHWRESVFGTELMSSGLRRGVADQLSAITIQSLADIGYTVDVEEADAYTLPAASAMANAIEAGPAIRIHEEVVTSPAVFYDRQGRVVRVLRN